ncbi:Ger(x)C family spore germination protein [Risungbinella massiliensis]|uniref:Ger(x)C family spore germination protein n=1 Tax=Risungbinella massiliensis TaxID=1329796 RepID=UPI0005CBB181|nr:Ger(x)C family spore germination protein [Risungbinella massiliensis]
MNRRNLFLCILLLLFMTTGCWSKKELNELAIMSGVGIDKTEDGEFQLTAQVILPSEIATQTGGGNRTPVVIYKETGKTIFETVRKLTKYSPRKLYWSHLRVIVFGEALAKEGIAKAIDFISRDHEMRTDFYLLVAKGTSAEQILKVQTPLEKIPGMKVYKSLETSEKVWAPTKGTNLDELISNLSGEGRNPVLTGVLLKGDPSQGMELSNVERTDPSAKIQLDELAVFKKDRLVGYLNEEESKGYNYIEGNVKSTIVNVPCNSGIAAIEIIRTDTKVKGKYNNGKPSIQIETKLQGNVGEVECDLEFTNPKIMSELETKVKQDIQEKMEVAVKKTQTEFQSDIFGFGDKIEQADPKAWKNLQKKWEKEFPDLDVQIKVTAELEHTGTTSESVSKQKQE